MWSNFDNSVANVSGGFLNDSRSSTDERKRNTRRIESIVPLMIRHLLQSSNEVQIWGTTVRIITFIGVVRSMDKATTKITYEIEDETGRITAFRWLEFGRTTEESIIKLNTYVRIYGHMREQNEKKHVLVLKILPVTNLNELTNHLLEVIYMLLKSQNKLSNQDQSSNTTNNDVPMAGNNSISGLTKDQALIFKIIQAENDSTNGIERSTVISRASKSMVPNANDIIDFLISEGHIYTTVTDDHFKST